MQYLDKDVFRHMRHTRERENLPINFTGINKLHIENGHVVHISADRLNSDAAIQNFPFLHRLDLKKGRLHLRHCPRLRGHQDAPTRRSGDLPPVEQGLPGWVGTPEQ